VHIGEQFKIVAKIPLFPFTHPAGTAKKYWHEIEFILIKNFMEKSLETVDILNDLILINNDRIAGYEKAMEELATSDKVDKEDLDLTVLFEKMIDDSRDFRNALGKEVQVLGGEMAEGTMARGKIYRAWMDVKAIFTGKDRQSILDNCEAGEDAAQRAYKEALAEDDLPHFLYDLIMEQKELLKESHDEIKALRDMAV
jgi:uncharacterized protein (TIGR02284 family)